MRSWIIFILAALCAFGLMSLGLPTLAKKVNVEEVFKIHHAKPDDELIARQLRGNVFDLAGRYFSKHPSADNLHCYKTTGKAEFYCRYHTRQKKIHDSMQNFLTQWLVSHVGLGSETDLIELQERLLIQRDEIDENIRAIRVAADVQARSLDSKLEEKYEWIREEYILLKRKQNILSHLILGSDDFSSKMKMRRERSSSRSRLREISKPFESIKRTYVKAKRPLFEKGRKENRLKRLQEVRQRMTKDLALLEDALMNPGFGGVYVHPAKVYLEHMPSKSQYREEQRTGLDVCVFFLLFSLFGTFFHVSAGLFD